MKKIKIHVKSLMLPLMVVLFAACATSYQSNLEKARFALDAGSYTEAINYATSALADNPGDVIATRILANAYLGRSGIDFLDVAEGLTDLQDSAEPNFQVVAGTLPATATASDLRTAITTLEALTGIDDDEIEDGDLADAAFDLAIMQMVESFSLGVYSSNYFTSMDVSQISDSNRAAVQEDLVEFDNRMIASGVSTDEPFIEEVRQTFCVLEPLSASEGFTVSEYRVLVGCQLSSNPATFDTTAIDPAIANCDVVNPDTAAVAACTAQDTAL